MEAIMNLKDFYIQRKLDQHKQYIKRSKIIMEAIMNLEEFYIQKQLDKHKQQVKRRILSALFILIIGGITIWLI